MTIDEGRELAPSSQRFEELGATAGHAGNVVREQVGTIVEAAQTKAADVERRSKETAAATRQDATTTANRILELMRAAERELGDLRRSVSREADALRVVLGKAAARSGPALGAGPLDSVATPFEGEIGPPPQDAEVAPEAEPEAPPPEESPEAPAAADVVGEVEEEEAEEEKPAEAPAAEEAPEEAPAEEAPAEEPPAEEPPPEEPPAEEPPPEEPVAEEPPPEEAPAGEEVAEEKAPETWGAEPSGDALEAAISRAEEQSAAGPAAVSREARIADARRRVARKEDEELAEAYEIAVEARGEAERSGSAEQVEYWDMLVRATIAEAVDRSTFGHAGAHEESLSRREKKRRAKKLKRLTTARENALRAAPPSDQG